jgi:hypothetical protein
MDFLQGPVLLACPLCIRRDDACNVSTMCTLPQRRCVQTKRFSSYESVRQVMGYMFSSEWISYLWCAEELR